MPQIDLLNLPGKYLTGSGNCSVSGNSYVENAHQYYQTVMSWINKYFLEKPGGNLLWSFHLEYINSSSWRMITLILKKLKRCESQGGEIVINWHYQADDDEFWQEVQDFMEQIELNINARPYS